MEKDLGVIIAAAGQSSRFGQSHPKKPFLDLRGRPVWQMSAELFRARADVGPIVLVVSGRSRDGRGEVPGEPIVL
ncbi:MAG: NTP transferase domain-containing protein [Pirellulaceae bacterium]